jgi:hypothetical protein
MQTLLGVEARYSPVKRRQDSSSDSYISGLRIEVNMTLVHLRPQKVNLVKKPYHISNLSYPGRT